MIDPGEKISIAMATYNGALHLDEQLDSFTRQTRLPDELVICDDQSTDETIGLLNRFQKTAPFQVRIWKNEERLGYTKNFERALGLCSGDLLFLSDQDDIWLPSKIEIVCTAFENGNFVVISDCRLYHACIQEERSLLDQISSVGLSDAHHVLGCCTALRRSFLEFLRPHPGQYFSHDEWIHEVAGALGVRKVLPECLQLYRRHDRNTTSYFLYAPRKVTLLDLYRVGHGKDVRVGYREAIVRLDLVARALQDKGPGFCCSVENPPDLDSALSKIQDRRRAYVNRLAVIESPPVLRQVRAAQMLIEGEYQYFLGLKSFVKDCLRGMV